MKLQPLDIRRQTFTKGFRGYETSEVDAFLKQVADQQAALLDDLRQQEDRVRDAEAKLRHYERVELALQEALETARETGKRAEESAERESRAMIAAAEARAAEIVREAEQERFALRQDTAKLTTRQAEVAARLRGFLLSELEILAQFQGDDPIGFLKLQPADRPAAALPPAAADSPAVPEASVEATPTQADAPSAPEAPADDASPAPTDSAPEAPPAEAEASEDALPEPPAAAPPAWDLRSLVSGAAPAAEPSVTASEAEHERIRRILDELD